MAKKRQEALKLMKKELSEEHLSKKYGTIWRENFAARKLLHANDQKSTDGDNQGKKQRGGEHHRTRGGKRERSKSERAPRGGASGSSLDLEGDGTEKASDGQVDNKVRIRKKVRKKISVKRIKPKLDKNNSL